MDLPPIVSPEERQAAWDELLRKEKTLTRSLDTLAAQRRRLPMVAFDKEYVFEGAEGKATLVGLFDGRRRLIRFGLSVFLRDGARVFRSYFTTARGVDQLRADFDLRDLMPYGRQETWEDLPEGWPQTPAYQWWRLRDEYEIHTAMPMTDGKARA
ncbi:DUF899 family protein [Nonomuraea dietziae]|uniref:DUF899 family protein n=1 Tax=Nonomuraea dietziae TaxID=65515 RepID=UPI00341C4228